jgi:HD-GYP domain-containing protein (c-di-GMP phosphodiesterase class II)
VADITSPEDLLLLIERANTLAGLSGDLKILLDGFLNLCSEVSSSDAGAFYQAAPGSRVELLSTWQNQQISACRPDFCIPSEGPSRQGENAAHLSAESDLVLDSDPALIRHGKHLACELGLPGATLTTRCLMVNGTQVGWLQLMNSRQPQSPALDLICNRLAPDIQRMAQYQAEKDHGARLEGLIGILGQIGSSLDPSQILRMIISDASKLLNVELSSLFLVDDQTGDLILKISSREGDMNEESLRVPAGEGIIGFVVQTGKTVIVDDVQRDDRHYQIADKMAKLTSRSMISTPLRASPIQLGTGRGASVERIIGGLEAINKQKGGFNEVDTQLLETFANQAATVWEIAKLYQSAEDLFHGVIQALTKAIDERDPYTKGHSQRVSDLSVELATKLGLDSETIRHIKIGSMMHDIGKIGIPDDILRKPGRLTLAEYQVIKGHPELGVDILGNVHLLAPELAAIREHHERLDGSGYPNGLKGDQISLFGRIVAVADVYDALTSYRPYRDPLPADEAFHLLSDQAGSHYADGCIRALRECV